MTDSTPVYLSAVDEQRFGFRIARATAVTCENLPAIIEYCHENAVRMLIARCPTTDLHAVQALERQGFLLMDTLVYYSRSLENIPTESPPAFSRPGHIQVRSISPADAEHVKKVAQRAFQDYLGHYHADTRLDPLKCDETYADWAFQSCLSKNVADEVLIATQEGAILGFLTLQVKSSNSGELDLGDGILFGVVPEAQGKGIGRLLMVHAMQWLLSRQIMKMQISTQVTNLASQNVWASLGFRLSSSYYTFHKWFE